MSEILTHLINYAQNHTFIQAVGTEGSVNDTATGSDSWQDIDVTYFVADPTAFDFTTWVTEFGQPSICQHTEHSNLFGTHSNQWRIFLVQFVNSTRIDLKIAPMADLSSYLKNDSLNTIVWAQDPALTSRPTDDHSHRQFAPTQAAFNAVLNEFYWCVGNVAKGLARKQFLYASEMNAQHVRPQLLQMLVWTVACDHPEGFNPGVYDKYLEPELTKEVRVRLQQTYRQENLKKLRHSTLIEAALMIWAQQQVIQKTNLALPSYLATRMRQLDDWINRL